VRGLIVLLASGLCAAAAATEPVVSLNSTAQGGWTSNATETPMGPADSFIDYSHEARISASLGAMSLRGTLRLEQTIFQTITEENDISIAGGLEAGLVLAEGVSLRGGYGLTRQWTGEGVPTDIGLVGIAGVTDEREAFAELLIGGADQQVRLSLNQTWKSPGPSQISGLPVPLPPLRLDPAVGVTGVGVDWEKVVTPNVAFLLRLRTDHSHIPEPDQLEFGRSEAASGTAAAGVRISEQHFGVEVLSGTTVLWPYQQPALREMLPYIAARLQLALGDRLSIVGKGAARTEMDNPIDPVASRVMEGDISATIKLTDATSVTTGMGQSQESAIFGFPQTRLVHSAEVRLDHAFSERVRVSMAASKKWVAEMGERYEVTRVALGIGSRF
jgi:hypothetical protein